MKTAIINIGHIVTGDHVQLTNESNCILMEDGFITYIGEQNKDLSDYNLIMDADQATVIPGLIDSHVHVVIGDYTPRQKTVDFLESYTHGGITTSITASEVHAPGRPNDPEGVKALALAAQRCFETYSPGGMTVHAGSVIIEPQLTREDFKELAEQGVWLAKVGFGNFKRQGEAAEIVRYAQEFGFKVMCHTGGASIPGSSPVTAEDLIALQPDVSGHINGGPTAMLDEDLEQIIEETDIAMQIVQAGNIRTAIKTVLLAEELEQFERVLIASDTPTGTGTMPLAVIKSVVELSTMTGVQPEKMIAAATGNVGKAYGLQTGVIKEGFPADLLIVDAPLGGKTSNAMDAIANGDIPAISGCFTKGILRFITSRNTPPPTKGNIRVIQENLSVWS